jgi:hypothetical protein
MSKAHYIFLTRQGKEELWEEEDEEKVLARKLWKIIDSQPEASGVSLDTLRELLRDPDAFDA